MSKTQRQIADELLVLQWQAGSRKSFEILFTGWNKILYRHANRLTRNSAAAADVMQDAWVSMIKSIRSLGDPAMFRSWAYKIVTRRAADWVRREKRNRHLDQIGAVNELKEALHSEDSQEDETAQLTLALERLPGECHIVVAMFYLDELSVKEIAQALSIPTGTVKSRLYYSRQQLKSIIERQKNERD